MQGAEGNILLGVYRTDQETRAYSWSFHLWITEYDPRDASSQNWHGTDKYVHKLNNSNGEIHRYTGSLWDADDAMYHNKWIMDRNLGAKSDRDLGAEGLYYEFGRKDPLTLTKTPLYICKYDDNTKSYTYPKTTATSIGYSSTRTMHYFINYPKPYIYNTGKQIYANNDYANNLWFDPYWSMEMQGGETKKSFFDPCPPGWRVPQYKIWEKIKNYSTLVGTGALFSEGYYFYCDNTIGSENIAYYPGTGSFENSNTYTKGYLAVTSVNPYYSGAYYSLGLYTLNPQDNIGLGSYFLLEQAKGTQVRCVQE